MAAAGAMQGTAEQVDAWLLLEYKPSWAAKAISDGQLSAATRHWLQTTAERFAAAGVRLRPQLIRQPEYDRDETRLLLSYQGQVHHFDGIGYEFLQDLDLPSQLESADATALTAPQYFVCTNGKRDLCCARFGLPIYQKLRELVGDRVWQVTHLGGHRFAPNVLVTPQNVLYGRVSLAGLPEFVQRVERGELDFGFLRGRTAYSKTVQAAEALLGKQDLKLLHLQGDTDVPGAVAQVEFADTVQRYQVRLTRAPMPTMIQGSCTDTELKPYHPFEMVAPASG